jgi:hypothetical protein
MGVVLVKKILSGSEGSGANESSAMSRQKKNGR